MRGIVSFVFLMLFFVACENKSKKLLYSGSEKWNESVTGDTTTLRQHYEVYTQGEDTLIYFTNYFTTGKLKSKVIMKNDLLWEIEFVLYTLGNKKKFGKLKNGSGYVVEFTDDTDQPENSGKYINGNKEGWWMRYHFTGSVIDSTLYKDGFDISSKANNSGLELLIGDPGTNKNNYYK